MKKIINILFISIFISFLSCGQKETVKPSAQDNSIKLEETLYNALEKLAQNITNTSYSIIVEDIYLENSRVLMPLSDYLKNYIMSSCYKTGLFKVVQSQKDFTAIDDKTFVYRTDADFDGILLGKYYIEDDGIRVFFTLNKSDSRDITAVTDFKIAASLLPSHFNAKPSNYDDYKKNDQDANILEKNDFKVTLWTERGLNGIFKDGEKLVINIRSEQDCYIKLFHIGVDGSVKMIYPNKYEKNNFISANTTYKFPKPSMGFEFSLGAPYGIETIRLIAQSSQFDDLSEQNYKTDNPFTDLGNITSYNQLKDIITKGLNITANSKSVRKSEASYTFNIIK